MPKVTGWKSVDELFEQSDSLKKERQSIDREIEKLLTQNGRKRISPLTRLKRKLKIRVR